MLTVLLVNNALSAQTRLTSLIRRFGGQIMGQVSTLTAMFPLLKQQPISLVLIDLPNPGSGVAVPFASAGGKLSGHLVFILDCSGNAACFPNR